MRTLLVCIAVLFAQCADAAVTINIYESNGNVQAELSGSLNLDATLGFNVAAGCCSFYQPIVGMISFPDLIADNYVADIANWTPYGTGGYGEWDTSSGDTFFLWGNQDIGVPVGYVSGDPLSATATKNAATLATLGMTPGTYVNTLTNDSTSDTVTVIVGEAAPGWIFSDGFEAQTK